jgi:hypothetical protein
MAQDREMVPLGSAREATIEALSEHFAHDRLTVEEFERRVTVAHTADTVAAMEALLADLPRIPDRLPSAGGRAVLPPEAVRDHGRLMSVMGSATRRGRWTAPRHLEVSTVLGNVVLDFREARLPSGVVDVKIKNVLGNTEIIVPPGLAVETDGSAILGNFEHVARAPAAPDSSAPLLRIHGTTVLGNVEVMMRLPGESQFSAWLRTRGEERALRRAERARLASAASDDGNREPSGNDRSLSPRRG